MLEESLCITLGFCIEAKPFWECWESIFYFSFASEKSYLMVYKKLFLIFFEISAEEDSFDSFALGLYNMIVLQTTANFPDVMLQIYEHNRWAALYFVIFLIVNNILLVNMTLSIFYINYKELMEEKTETILRENKYSKFT